MSRRVNVHHYHHSTSARAGGGGGWALLGGLVILGLLVKFWFIWVPGLALCGLAYLIHTAVQSHRAATERRHTPTPASADSEHADALRRLAHSAGDNPDDMTEDTVMRRLSPDVTTAILTNLKQQKKRQA